MSRADLVDRLLFVEAMIGFPKEKFEICRLIRE